MITDNPAPNIYQGKNWTVDNFGPYLVPSGHFFVLGDNRHNAMDSRYVGPIPVKDCKGAVIKKF
jgi:signal peptidase I